MIVAVPAPAPVTVPELEPMVAIPELLLVHIPPVGVQLSKVVNAVHTVVVPDIDPGADVTLTVFVEKQLGLIE